MVCLCSICHASNRAAPACHGRRDNRASQTGAPRFTNVWIATTPLLAALRRPAIGSGVPPPGDRLSDPLTPVAVPESRCANRFHQSRNRAQGLCRFPRMGPNDPSHFGDRARSVRTDFAGLAVRHRGGSRIDADRFGVAPAGALDCRDLKRLRLSDPGLDLAGETACTGAGRAVKALHFTGRAWA